ncbi:MAG: ATP-binding protein [Thiobacillaceae bacterium]|jgi:two-component system OmpR family sensor kinase
MKNSLQQRLSIWLSIAIVATGFLAAGVSFWFAYDEAQEFQDNSLRQIATLVDADRLPSDGQRSSGAADSDPEARIIVERLATSPAIHPQRLALPAHLTTGFHTLDVAGNRWRLYVRALKSGERIAVAQEIQVRAEAARDSALRTLLPLLALIPLLVFLSRRLVSASLAPIRALAQVTDAQQEDRPSALPTAQVPEEVAPFVHSINRLLERITRLMGQQRRFIADAAHELRSPLTALSLQAQNLRQADSTEAMRERVVPLMAGIERARHLTEQLLSLARTQAATASQSNIDVSAMVRELIADYLPMAEAKKIDLGLEEMAPLSILANPEVLRLIVRNALENALKYTPVGGEVTLRLRTMDDDAVIEVIDNGPGIPVAERERVFDSFYRLPETTGEGSGLGLAIAREAAIRLGGRVSLHERQAGPGLIFRYQHGRPTID